MEHIYTKSELLAQLKALQIPRDKVVLMHSSLRLIGKIEGGAETLLDALIEHFTETGGLFCVPTHTWGNLDKEITLDMNDPKTCLGAFSDFAAADPRGIRSENPTHSMIVFGDRKKAENFVKGEINVPSGTAPQSCYGKIYEMGGYILLAGVAHNRNTYLHAVDEILNTPNRVNSKLTDVKVKRSNGEIVSSKLALPYTDYTGDISWRFVKYETAFRYRGAVTDGKLGNAPVQACDARIMKETVELITKRSTHDPLSDEQPIPATWYC